MRRFIEAAVAVVTCRQAVPCLAHPAFPVQLWLKEALGSNVNLYVLVMVISILAGGVVVSLATSKSNASTVARGS